MIRLMNYTVFSRLLTCAVLTIVSSSAETLLFNCPSRIKLPSNELIKHKPSTNSLIECWALLHCDNGIYRRLHLCATRSDDVAILYKFRRALSVDIRYQFNS